MEERVEGLLNILAKECGLYRDLYDLSRKKSEIIINGDIGGLTEMLSVEEQLIVELGYLEAQREEMIEKWASSTGVDSERLNISNIMPFVEENSKKRLESLSDDINQAISQLRQINDLNENLIKNNLEYIDFSLKLFAGQEDSGAVYSKGGKQTLKSQNRNLLDKKV